MPGYMQEKQGRQHAKDKQQRRGRETRKQRHAEKKQQFKIAAAEAIYAEKHDLNSGFRAYEVLLQGQQRKENEIYYLDPLLVSSPKQEKVRKSIEEKRTQNKKEYKEKKAELPELIKNKVI